MFPSSGIEALFQKLKAHFEASRERLAVLVKEKNMENTVKEKLARFLEEINEWGFFYLGDGIYRLVFKDLSVEKNLQD